MVDSVRGGLGSGYSHREDSSEVEAPESESAPSLDLNDAERNAQRVASYFAVPAAERYYPEPAALRVLGTLALMGGVAGITRGELLAGFAKSGGKTLAASTGFGAISQLHNAKLIDVLDELTQPHRITGRVSHRIRINAHGLRVLEAHALVIRTLEIAAASRASPTSNLN